MNTLQSLHALPPYSSPILVHSSPSIVSGLAEGALVRDERMRASQDKRDCLSIGQGWVVNVEEEDT